jgi:hypothetical protein
MVLAPTLHQLRQLLHHLPLPQLLRPQLQPGRTASRVVLGVCKRQPVPQIEEPFHDVFSPQEGLQLPLGGDSRASHLPHTEGIVEGGLGTPGGEDAPRRNKLDPLPGTCRRVTGRRAQFCLGEANLLDYRPREELGLEVWLAGRDRARLTACLGRDRLRSRLLLVLNPLDALTKEQRARHLLVLVSRCVRSGEYPRIEDGSLQLSTDATPLG